MPIYSQPGGNSIGSFDNVVGAPVVVNLTTTAKGDGQNNYIVPSDYVIIPTADGTNLSVTLPDPNKYGGTSGDMFRVVNAASGQTIKIYPPTGGNIDGAGANTAITIATNKSVVVHMCSYTSTTSVWTSTSHA